MSTKLKAGTASSGAVLDADTTGILEFQSGSTPTTAVTIDASQNVGIGGSPLANNQLTLYRSTYSQFRMQNATTGTGSSDGFRTLMDGVNVTMTNHEAGYIAFETSDTERMRIDSSGNVGIGTSTASSSYGKLTVAGTGITTTEDTASKLQIGRYSAGAPYSYIKLSANSSGLKITNPADTADLVTLDSTGNLLVNTNAQFGSGKVGVFYNQSTDRGITLQNTNATNTGNYLGFYNSSGTLQGTISQTNSSTTAYNTSSDYRLKEDIAPIIGALAKVSALKPVTYKWKSDGSDGQGFIAHELAEVVPDCVTGEKDAVDAEGNPVYQSIDTSFLVATLTAAIQEQQVMIEELKTKVAALEAK